jgi:antibiotic biosynthesis monooxygenase (ABM) superfamily enzyme
MFRFSLVLLSVDVESLHWLESLLLPQSLLPLTSFLLLVFAKLLASLLLLASMLLMTYQLLLVPLLSFVNIPFADDVSNKSSTAVVGVDFFIFYHNI